MNFDLYTALWAISLLTLLTTLKLTLTSRVTVGPQKKTFILFHPLWLGGLVVEVPYVIGRFMAGALSPWPLTAFAQIEDKAGLWAGLLAGTATLTVDLWLFWTTATALLTFTQPMATAYEPIPRAMHKYVHLVNLLAGAYVVFKALKGHAS